MDLMVPRAGLEPAHREAEDFETSVSTIPPSGHKTSAVYKKISQNQLENATFSLEKI